MKSAMRSILAVAIVAGIPSIGVRAAEVKIPIVVPITGYLSVEGGSQRNGAVMALSNPPAGVTVTYEVVDTGTSATGAANALERALSAGDAIAVAASVFGTELLAMMPIALDHKVPLITISGTAKITEMGNPYILRFFPSDAVVKVAHARYAVEELGKKRPAVIYDTTAYGQSGHDHLLENFKKLGVTPVFDEVVSLDVKDMLPVLNRVKQANADVLILHMIAQPMALIIKQAKAMGLNLPVVAGSSMIEPTAAELLEPAELKDVCGETGSSPASGGAPEMEKWAADYRTAFNTDPDGLALAQYDGLMMVLEAVAKGAKTPEDVRAALSSTTYKGIAMTYKSNGRGDMAHSAVIACYDGTTRTPTIAKRYENITGVL